MDIVLDAKSRRPLYVQLRDALRARLLTGAIPGGTRLPATRELAARLHISRNTVEEAYAMLKDEGLIQVRPGQGAFARPGTQRGGESEEEAPDFPWKITRDALDVVQTRVERGYASLGGKDLISFASSAPDHHPFEIDAFRHAMDDALLREGDALLSAGYTRGYEPLREYIRAYLTGKGLRMKGQEVLIVNGFRQGAGLTLRTLCPPGSLVAVETPTYNGFLSTLQANGLRALPLPCDGDGLIPEILEKELAVRKPSLLYMIPTYHNPTGRNMPLARRAAVLRIARDANVPILEDGFSEELRFAGESYPALKALPGAEGVIHVSSVSKVLFPGLRIGWAVAPEPVFTAMTQLKYVEDISTPPLLQAALFDYLRGGGLERHLRRIRPVCRERLETLHAAVDGHFQGRAAYDKSEGGLGTWLRFPDGFNSRAFLNAAREKGATYVPGGAFFVEESQGAPFIRLGISKLSNGEIERGMEILSSVFKEKGF